MDKYIKIDTVLIGALTSGILVFSKSLEQNPDWDEAKKQMLNFEKGGNYPVDFPDTLADLLIQLSEYIASWSEDEQEDDSEANNKPIFGKRKVKGF